LILECFNDSHDIQQAAQPGSDARLKNEEAKTAYDVNQTALHEQIVDMFLNEFCSKSTNCEKEPKAFKFLQKSYVTMYQAINDMIQKHSDLANTCKDTNQGAESEHHITTVGKLRDKMQRLEALMKDASAVLEGDAL